METKIRSLIKAYLVLNRGKKKTGKEICEFINCGEFHLNNHSVTPNRVALLVKKDGYELGNMLYNVQVESVNGYNRYWVEP